MRNVLIVGGEATGAYARALEEEGFVITVHPPGGDDGPAGDYDAVILDLAGVGEDPLARRYLEAAAGGDAPPVIGLVEAGHLAAFDPAKDLDDFLVAGATPAELCARVRQALWKRHRVDARNVLKIGDLVMDLGNYTVHVGGRRVELTFKEYELLRFLATNRDRVYTRETLLSKVWGYDFYGGARTVDVHVRRLRSKIEDRHNTFIETVRNVGYRFKIGP
jgi:DNA-binding response OmpR family regulator